MYTPKVSIILTTYNCEESIEKILDSIEMQDYLDIEVNIKDGLSKDNTMQIIDAYKERSKFTVNVISEADTGIYDAMNQGYKLSTGDVLVFCSDVFIFSDAVSSIVDAMDKEGEGCVGAHADLVYATPEKIVRYWRMRRGHIRKGWMPGHPTLYLKREIYERYGLFKTDYKISADYEFMVRVCKDNEDKIAYLPKTIINMSYGGTSNATAGSYWQSLMEANRALRENGYKFPWMISFRRTLKLIWQFVAAKTYKGAI